MLLAQRASVGPAWTKVFSELQEKEILKIEKHDGGVPPSVHGGAIQERRLVLSLVLAALFQELIKALAPSIITSLVSVSVSSTNFILLPRIPCFG